jgi:hypothetical protein
MKSKSECGKVEGDMDGAGKGKREGSMGKGNRGCKKHYRNSLERK